MAGGAGFLSYSAVDLGVEVPHDLVPLDVADVDQIRLIKGQTHGEVLGLVNIVGLEKIAVGRLRLVAFTPDNMKSQGCSSFRGVFFSIPRSLRRRNSGFRQKSEDKFGYYSLQDLVIFAFQRTQDIV